MIKKRSGVEFFKHAKAPKGGSRAGRRRRAA
jgi:hypothetical protein